MYTKIFTIFSLSIFLMISGCATRTKMALSNDTDTISKTGKPIFLMTATLKNTYKTSHQPKLKLLYVEKSIVKGSEDRLNFIIDDKGKNETDSETAGNSYFLRMELEQGEYVLLGLLSHSHKFPVLGSFFTPIHANLKPSAPGVYYLGHIDATVRERKGTEFKAGLSIPIIDQAVVGASGGSFDVVISDKWERDKQKFQEKFPILNSVNIQKFILPPFDRAKAQKYWEEN